MYTVYRAVLGAMNVTCRKYQVGTAWANVLQLDPNF
jgi:hypothetical protein